MTVCVAAIFDGNMVCGMSDRMLTAGDVQFQPSSSKIWEITKSIVMMSSGDVGLQTEIYSQVKKIVDNSIKEKPDDWFRVEDVAELYRQAYFSLKKRRAEKEILIPLGLDSHSFLTRQRGMDSELVSKISMELIGYRMPDVAAIIAGNNPLYEAPKDSKLVSAHIFIVENGKLSCADKVGFACVGAGAWHANSTMMFAGHTPLTQAPKALLTVYAAKKRAEVAPGVGAETDTFVVTPFLGGHSTLRDEIRDAVIKAYDDNMQENTLAKKKIEDSLREKIDEIITPKKPVESQTSH